MKTEKNGNNLKDNKEAQETTEKKEVVSTRTKTRKAAGLPAKKGATGTPPAANGKTEAAAKKAEAKATSKKPEPKKAKGKKERELPDRKLVEGVKALVLAREKIAIKATEVVYKSPGAWCIWDKISQKRIAWIKKDRVKGIETAKGNQAA